MPSNLPPGVTEGMIPGNRPEDIQWEKVHNELDDIADRHALEPHEMQLVLNLGLAAFNVVQNKLNELEKLQDQLMWGELVYKPREEG